MRGLPPGPRTGPAMRGRAGAALRYGAYLGARALPTPPLAHRWRLCNLVRYELFTADPRRIRHRLAGPDDASASARRRYRLDLLEAFRRGWALPGDWDRRAEEFDARAAIEEVLVERLGTVDEGTVARLTEAVASGSPEPVLGIGLSPDVEAYLTEVVRLAASLREVGLRAQRELRGRPTSDEITVCLSREGDPLLLLGGNHRVSLARYLGLDAVPVLVCGVHEQWLAGCTRSYGTSARAIRGALAEALGSPVSR